MVSAVAGTAYRGETSRLSLSSCAQLTMGTRRWNSYRVMGMIGYTVAVILVMILASRAQLGIVTRLVLALVPPVLFVVGVKLSVLLLGYERIVFYEKSILALLGTALVLWLVDGPVRAGVDLATLGVGTFLAFGRVGCFRVACCHGRVGSWGVRYGHEHVHAGLPRRFAHTSVFPLQLVDGGISACLVLGGVVAIGLDAGPGVATAIYVCGYAVARFFIELVRGDSNRPYWRGVSEAQWTAVVTSCAMAAYVPSVATAVVAAGLAIAGLGLVIARRRFWLARVWLTAPPHIDEVAAAFDELRARPTGDAITTSEGLRLSAHPLPELDALDVVVSHQEGKLSLPTLRRIAGQLWDRVVVLEVLDGVHAMHVLVQR